MKQHAYKKQQRWLLGLCALTALLALLGAYMQTVPPAVFAALIGAYFVYNCVHNYRRNMLSLARLGELTILTLIGQVIILGAL